MTLDTERAFPVVGQQIVSLCRVHAVARGACNDLAVTRVYYAGTDGMGNIMLFDMACGTYCDSILTKKERPLA